MGWNKYLHFLELPMTGFYYNEIPIVNAFATAILSPVSTNVEQ